MISLPLRYIVKINTFSDEFPEIVFKYYISKLRYAIEHNEKTIHLFKSTDTPYVFGVEQLNYLNFLTSLLDILVKKELYELATECRNLIDKLKIDNLIESIKSNDGI